MDTPICLPNIKISEDDLMCVIKRDGKTAIIDQTVRITELEAQVAALKKIAIEEVAIRIAYENNMCLVECRGYARRQARRQLAEEHPEIFGD